ncbi:arginyl-tRNA synthetase [Magnetococcus marinus MC-1]|uniref:Arginine--tRNA ligase n=1 Tax=Magnetococcus marinus (strain ATCC BAA-1437 / JCM 17883 / MC-1) TaxID=156889 RepID=SYR_MAGMM|nr:arginine--tRNA ligase [Magnetococcus marinus]A0L5I2.1 RecName: Full=Arginine--tRNA ligase; AltName: Full=Arginyl-tRNA synthetase; Short=ArgRS [Magnetococcus marinus MC-1]ABK43225.1 arginyl-tRNA synthetase [Magnetococcus marinus MC-1]
MRQSIEELMEHAQNTLLAEGVIPADAKLGGIKVERPKDKSHGDFSINTAMVLAKQARMKPRDLAQRLVDALPSGQGVVSRCEIAGPGFINFFVTPERLRGVVADVLQRGGSYGQGNVGAGQKVLVEFVSANPTGPMHVGHGRGAVTGDVLARILECAGYAVQREYYLNDAGVQVQVLGRSVMLRYRQLFGDAVEVAEGCYPGDYVVDIARALKEKDQDKWLEVARAEPDEYPREMLEFAMQQVLTWIKADLARLNIRFDHWFSEFSLHSEGRIEHALEVLSQKGCLYEGVLEPPKGKKSEAWASRPQLLFKATDFGDEVDRALRKSDGSYTYFAADVAYHLNKAERGFERLVNIWGADHGGYVRRVQAALGALTGKQNLLDVVLIQMVNLTRGGEPVKMSKRAGTFVTLEEVVEATSSDAVRFWFLSRGSGAQLDFDLDLAVAKNNDNPVYYVQYAHARICSIWDKAQHEGVALQAQGWSGVDLSPLGEGAEWDLIRKLDLFPDVVEGAAVHQEPHRIPYYLLDLAAAFHTFYNSHRIMDVDAGTRDARLVLILAVKQVIANGLELLGVQQPRSM